MEKYQVKRPLWENLDPVTVNQVNHNLLSRVGKETHGLVVVRNLLIDKENWIVPNNESEWQFPGNFSERELDKHEQCIIAICGGL